MQVQVSALNNSLDGTQEMLSGWKDKDQIVASDNWYLISIAPYQNNTHECYYQVLNCQSEMVGTPIYYLVAELGEVFYLQGEAVTGDNGFLDLYLPVNKTYQINVYINGLRGNVTIMTFPNSPTCITTLQVH